MNLNVSQWNVSLTEPECWVLTFGGARRGTLDAQERIRRGSGHAD